MKKIISFSLYGTAPCYQNGALENVQFAKRIYPGWFCRFYISQEIPQNIVNALRQNGAEVILKTRKYKSDGMFWRFLPAGEPGNDVVIVRDADSRITEREKAAVDAWLESGDAFHIMRDHPLHTARIMGGMWGVRGGRLSDIHALICKWQARRFLDREACFRHKGMDQIFLTEMVYPRIQHDVCIHSEFTCFEGEKVSPFPVRGTHGEFVGIAYQDLASTGNDVTNNYHRKDVKEFLHDILIQSTAYKKDRENSLVVEDLLQSRRTLSEWYISAPNHIIQSELEFTKTAYFALIGSGLQRQALSKEEKAFRDTILEQDFNHPKRLQYLLVAMMYCSPHQLPQSWRSQLSVPKWATEYLYAWLNKGKPPKTRHGNVSHWSR